MTTDRLNELGFEQVTTGTAQTVTGGFCGDLLSWVMGRAQEGQVWFTVIGNVNTVAVATLTGVSAIVLCNGAMPDADMKEKAVQQGVNVYTTPLTEYEAAVLISKELEP